MKKGEFVCVIGDVACGKTSLLSAIIGDMIYTPHGKFEEPPIKLNGRLCYVEQQAWIQNMTIRDNICFGKPYDEALYTRTVVAC